MNLVEVISKEYDIPVVEDAQKIWFFRTKGGKFYYDFRVNNYIALGWDFLSSDFITDKKATREQKYAIIEKYYPDEKRPGLIMGQMEIFYLKMQEGDLVVIPSGGGREISIGRLGAIQDEVKHKVESEEYPTCQYVHKRAVNWEKVVDVGKDIYLFKALRAQQTISDLSGCKELILRNLFPVYVSESGIHITLQKDTDSNLNLYQNVSLYSNILKIMDTVTEFYGKESFCEDIVIKTAVGSLGFMELILPCTPIAIISAVATVRIFIGKTKGSDGTSTGLLALLGRINELTNDYHNRKKIDAETQLLLAQASKTKSEEELIRAQTERTKIENTMLNHKYEQISFTSHGETITQLQEEQENLSLTNTIAKSDLEPIIECGERICVMAAENGISFNGKRFNKAK